MSRLKLRDSGAACMNTAAKRRPARPPDNPTTWFCVLEIARRKADAAMERRALANLRRLGVEVRWPASEGGRDAR